ncbi:uncharacterized protein Z518_05822 [Rhinocladiella mackenziei CBS 650.93]|uniref:BZIP domain-containing protein n=1 Tax=Rhinocladiella mackenziei CBS 650.93 TaxID=1442369 RepID=A0A0D2IP76_9EURO|nr:uncharacterized protein Z518_05822 [Rhinocladiella mackenziei CBS 650.93]KIX04951.1 hypothetical protein Z518_05822 [Rhinocladiella mackenziei CBS 650.93]
MTDYHTTNGWAQQQATFSPIDSSFQWGYTGVQSPKNMVRHYNDLLQRAADFYATLDNSFDSMSSSGSDSSYRSTPERRVSSTTNVVAQVKSSIPDKIERRREQNRSSQRAYRERKERHQKELEEQIAQWQQRHQLLSRSYSQQTEEINRLKAQIEQLNGEISQLQSGLPTLCGSLCQSPQEFDLVPFFNHDTPSPQSTPRLSPSCPIRRGS